MSKKLNPFANKNATNTSAQSSSINTPNTSPGTPTTNPFAGKVNNSVFNPFGATTTTAAPLPGVPSQPTQQSLKQDVGKVISREVMRSAAKQAGAEQRTTDYKKFLSFQDENKEILKRSSPRQMVHDKTRLVHKIWKASIILSALALGYQWFSNVRRERIEQILPFAQDGLSLSMFSPTQLDELGGQYLGEDLEIRTSAPQSLREERSEIYKNLINPQYVYHTPHPDVPCFPQIINFRQCMGYIPDGQGQQPHKKLDQCWIPLQRANMCMFQHRLQPFDLMNPNPINTIHLIEVDHKQFEYEKSK